MKGKQTKRMVDTALDALSAQLEQGQSEQLNDYLATMARFHQYSLNNILLIATQKPSATRVAGYRAWLKLGRQVRQGEKGIRILAPMIRHHQKEIEKDHDEAIFGFRTVCVFDVNQTDGKPLPEFATVNGDPGNFADRLKQFVATRGIALEYSDRLGAAQGISRGGRITLKAGLVPAEEFSVLVHELGHEMLHSNVEDRPGSKIVRETEAEAIAFIVCHAVGLDGNSSSSDYIQLWQGDKDTLLASLERIRTASSAIMAGIQPRGHDVGKSASK